MEITKKLCDIDDRKKKLFCDHRFVKHHNQGFRIWRIKQNAFDKECMKRLVKLVTNIMVLACLTLNAPGKPFINFERIKFEIYKKIDGNYMIPPSEDLCDGGFIISIRPVSTNNWIRQQQIYVNP